MRKIYSYDDYGYRKPAPWYIYVLAFFRLIKIRTR